MTVPVDVVSPRPATESVGASTIEILSGAGGCSGASSEVAGKAPDPAAGNPLCDGKTDLRGFNGTGGATNPADASASASSDGEDDGDSDGDVDGASASREA